MTFAELLTTLNNSEDNCVTVPKSWAQGRAGYGGLVAALIYEGMRAKVEEGRPVRSLAITFAGPVAPDVPMHVEARVLRQGRAVTQMLGMAMQNGEVMCVVQGSFGASRESYVHVEAEPAPAMTSIADSPEMPFVDGVNPVFAKHFKVRWALGDLPCTNSKNREMGGWMSFAKDEGEIHEAHILGLVDVWPPAILPHLRERAPASSLTWTIEFIQPQPALANTGWLKYRAEVEYARDGYGHTNAMIWTEAGELLAISRQTVTVFG